MPDNTHNPHLECWVASASDPKSDFPVQNLPYGIFSRDGEEKRVGVAIGDQILDVARAVDEGVIGASQISDAFSSSTMNTLMAADNDELSEFRKELSVFLTTPANQEVSEKSRILVPMSDATMYRPADIGDYTDFYASIHHAANVGSMFRPDNPLLPNYKHVPIGYHGRASSIVPSGHPIRRPCGQTKAANASEPSFGPSRMLDYECELGFFVGRGNALGETIAIDDAFDHIFGFCIVNDWSARDIQAWEYQPLGPFLAKNFATSLSPWVITRDAAEPYRAPVVPRSDSDPAPLEYLSSAKDRERGALPIRLEVFIQTSTMKSRAIAPHRLSSAPFEGMYWTVSQMLAHHASNGCNLRPGDLLASGTVSGDSPDSRGCLLELTWRGSQPVRLPSGEERRFLEDGDEVIMRAYLEAPGRRRIGFGECRGTILPAQDC